MSDIRNVHVLISGPKASNDYMLLARAELMPGLPKQFALSCGIPQPYVEVCCCATTRTDIHVRISGLDTVCGKSKETRRDAIDTIERTVKSYARGVEVKVIDDDDENDFREHPDRHLHHRPQHADQPRLI